VTSPQESYKAIEEQAKYMLNFLKHFLSNFRRLQWRMTFSYILIAAVALLVTIVVATLILIQFVLNQYLQNASSVLQARAPMALDHLINHANIADDVTLTDEQMGLNYDDPTTGTIVVIAPQVGYTVLIDPNGRVLASSDTNAMAEGRLLFTQLPLDGINVVRTAIKNNTNNNPTIITDQKQALFAAIALFDHQRHPVGILLTMQKLPSYGEIIAALFPLLWSTLVFMTCLVGIVGTLSGFIMSRWLVQRLMKVTQATESWSQGNFSSMIVDRSGDELGVMTRQLNDMAGKLEQLLSERQNIAVLEERNRMARDLHDSLKQQLFASIMQVWSAQGLLDTNIAGAKERLDTIEELLGQAQQELSTLIHQLRPLALVDKPFSVALRDYSERWAKQHNIALYLDIAEVDLSLKAEEALLRITQEALSNIVRHSNASAVQVQLVNQQEQVLLTITDNGRGFDLEHVSNQSMGLQSMQERMEMLRGSLSIVSKEGHGTCISATYIKGGSSRL
jgi:NarL family two-component system sensor histidine kinase LiaS